MERCLQGLPSAPGKGECTNGFITECRLSPQTFPLKKGEFLLHPRVIAESESAKPSEGDRQESHSKK
ncbi:hypothetical protein [Laspinema palackyanum]|uniref:hypothetical protein n=1 Tax=Laspinema palackyanum TaxID=3231601 RepID=UPI00349F362E